MDSSIIRNYAEILWAHMQEWTDTEEEKLKIIEDTFKRVNDEMQRECLKSENSSFLSMSQIITIFKWYKYPDSIPIVDEDDTFSEALIVATSTGDIIDDVRYRSWKGVFIRTAMGYDHHRFELDDVIMFGYLKSLTPIKQ